MFWRTKKPDREDVERLVATNFYAFHDPTFAAAVKAGVALSSEAGAQRPLVAMRALHVLSCVYAGLCIMECAEVGLRTPDGDARIDSLVRAGLKAFMEDAPGLYDEMVPLFSSRTSEINTVLQMCGGRPRSEGNAQLVMFAFDRILGSGEFAERADDLAEEAQIFAKAILDLRVSFLKGLKR